MKIIKKGVHSLLALALLLSIPYSCEEDDELNIIAGLDFVVATLNRPINQKVDNKKRRRRR